MEEPRHRIEVDGEDDRQEQHQQNVDRADQQCHNDDGEEYPPEWEPSPAFGLRFYHQRAFPSSPSSISSASRTSSLPLPNCLDPFPPCPGPNTPIFALSSSSCWSELPLYSSASNCRAS